MGVTKKPAVVAKTAPKKRGRPVGSKGKKKTMADIKIGETVSFKRLNELNSAGWVPPAVDWEKLAKQLQAALAAEMRECETYKNLFEEMQEYAKPVRLLTFWQRVKLVFTGRY